MAQYKLVTCTINGKKREQMDRLFGRWFLRHVFHLALSLRKARSGMSGKI